MKQLLLDTHDELIVDLFAGGGGASFPADYIIDRGASGKPITKSEQVRMCGNSVCPPVVTALVRANCPELSVSRRRSA